MARKESTKQRNEAIPTIIGAGITEKWYFTHLQAKYRVRMKTRPRFFGKETVWKAMQELHIVELEASHVRYKEV